MLSPATARNATRATYEHKPTDKILPPGSHANARRADCKFYESRCGVRSDKRTHISDILGKQRLFYRITPRQRLTMNAAHTEHCGSIRIADETLGDTLYAVKNNSGWNEPDDIPPQ